MLYFFAFHIPRPSRENVRPGATNIFEGLQNLKLIELSGQENKNIILFNIY